MQVKQFKTDPLMDQGPMRVMTGNAFIKAFHEISAGAKQLTLPILLVGSRTDQVPLNHLSVINVRMLVSVYLPKD